MYAAPLQRPARCASASFVRAPAGPSGSSSSRRAVPLYLAVAFLRDLRTGRLSALGDRVAARPEGTEGGRTGAGCPGSAPALRYRVPLLIPRRSGGASGPLADEDAG